MTATVEQNALDLHKRHIEHDIDLLAAEVVALFRAEYVLHNSENNHELPEEMREKRRPFLQLSSKLVRAELKSRLDELHLKLAAWKEL